MGFLVARPRNYAIFTSEFLDLSTYSIDNTTGGMLCRMEIMSVADRLRKVSGMIDGKIIWVGRNLTVSIY